MKRLIPLALVAALGGAIAADVVAPASAPVPPTAEPLEGGDILACPLGVEGDARAFLHLANLGERPSGVRVSVVPSRGKAAIIEQQLGAGRARTVRLHGRVKGRAAVVVEHTGGQIAASHSLWFRRKGSAPLGTVVTARGAAASSCALAGARVIAVPHLATAGSREARLLLYNPGVARADVSISLLTPRRSFRPDRLSLVGIEPRRFRMIRIEDFAFNEPEVTAVVEARNGRVVAEALLVSGGGVALVAGEQPQEQLYAVGGASGGGASLGIATPGDVDSGLAGTLIGGSAQGRAAQLPADLIPSRSVRRTTPRINRGGPAAYGLAVTSGDPIAAGVSWPVERRGTDLAATGGSASALRWIGAAGMPIEGGQVRAIVVNPGGTKANVRVRRIGGDGAEDLAIEPGRLERIPIGRGTGSFGIGVESDQPVVVLIEAVAAESAGGRVTPYGYGAYATPVIEHGPVPVGYDPRAGVAAPLTRDDQ